MNAKKSLPYGRSEAKSWARKALRGIIEAPITPLTSDFEIDESALRRNVEEYVKLGVAGLAIGGNLGEAWAFRPSDWYRLHEIVADAARGRIPLWTIILDTGPKTVTEKMARVQELGYIGAEVMNPMLLRSDALMVDYFKYISAASDLAIVLYRTPVSGPLLGTAALEAIADIPTVVGMKQGSQVSGETPMLRQLLGDGLVVMEPSEAFLLYDLVVDGPAVLFASPVFGVYGRRRGEILEYIALAEANKFAEAWKLWKNLRGVSRIYMDIINSRIVKEHSYAAGIPALKHWYELVGFQAGPPHPPVGRISETEAEALEHRLRIERVI